MSAVGIPRKAVDSDDWTGTIFRNIFNDGVSKNRSQIHLNKKHIDSSLQDDKLVSSSPFRIESAAAPVMEVQESGRILNISTLDSATANCRDDDALRFHSIDCERIFYVTFPIHLINNIKVFSNNMEESVGRYYISICGSDEAPNPLMLLDDGIGEKNLQDAQIPKLIGRRQINYYAHNAFNFDVTLDMIVHSNVIRECIKDRGFKAYTANTCIIEAIRFEEYISNKTIASTPNNKQLVSLSNSLHSRVNDAHCHSSLLTESSNRDTSFIHTHSIRKYNNECDENSINPINENGDFIVNGNDYSVKNNQCVDNGCTVQDVKIIDEKIIDSENFEYFSIQLNFKNYNIHNANKNNDNYFKCYLLIES